MHACSRTFSLDEELIDEGRKYARAHGTSLNALIRELLAKTARENPGDWLEDCFRKMDAADGHSAGRKRTREDLYDV